MVLLLYRFKISMGLFMDSTVYGQYSVKSQLYIFIWTIGISDVFRDLFLNTNIMELKSFENHWSAKLLD